MLLISNPQGPVKIRGWALDRLRVRLVKRVSGATPEARKASADRIGIALDEMKGGAHLVVRTGLGLTLEQKLLDRSAKDSVVELEIRAPAHYQLQVTGSPEVLVRDWAADLEVRTRDGEVKIQDSKVDEASILCTNCRSRVDGVRGNSLRVVSAAGETSVSGSEFGKVFLETGSGKIDFRNSGATGLWITSRAGPIELSDFRGSVEFQTREGTVLGERLHGQASGRTGSGKVDLDFTEWRPTEPALLDTDSGDVFLRFGSEFSADVELASAEKTVTSEIEIRSEATPITYGPSPARDRNWRGRIGKGGQLLQVRSKSGSIRIGKSRGEAPSK